MRTPVILVAGQKDTDPVVGGTATHPRDAGRRAPFRRPRGAPNFGGPATQRFAADV